MARIAHLTTSHSPLDTRIFYRECCALRRAGHDMHVVACGADMVQSGIHIVGVPAPRRRAQRMLLTAYRVLRRAIELSADVYHIHEPELLPWAVALKARTRKRVIYDLHEYYREAILGRRWLPAGLRRPVSDVVAWLEPALASQLDAVVTADDGQRKLFQRRGHLQSVITLRNLPPRDLFGDGELPNGPLPRRLLHIGSISDDRGWPEIQAIAEALRTEGVEVVIVGKKPQGEPPTNMVMTGYMPLPEIVQRARKGGIGLSALRPTPQHQLGVSVKVFEYMALGLPIVTSDIPPHREMVERYGVGRLYPAEDTKACVSEVLWLFAHADEALEMSRRGRRAYLQELNFDHEGAKLVTLYQELLHA